MPYPSDKDPEFERKLEKWVEDIEFFRKKYGIHPEVPIKTAKIAKNAQTTVKVGKIDGNPCSEIIFDEFKGYGEPIERPTSVPNPNDAFRSRRRTLSRISNELEHLSREEEDYE